MLAFKAKPNTEERPNSRIKIMTFFNMCTLTIVITLFT